MISEKRERKGGRGRSYVLLRAIPVEVRVETVEGKGLYCSLEARLRFLELTRSSTFQCGSGPRCVCVREGGKSGRTSQGWWGLVGLLHVEAVSGLSREAGGGSRVAVAGVPWLGRSRSRRGGQHQLLT